MMNNKTYLISLLFFIATIFLVFLFLIYQSKSRLITEEFTLRDRILNDVDRDQLIYAISKNSKKIKDKDIYKSLSTGLNKKPDDIYVNGSFMIYYYDSGSPKVIFKRLEFE